LPANFKAASELAGD